MSRKLKPRERAFCTFYAYSGDSASAARQAGLGPDFRLCGERLLADSAVAAEIERQFSRRKALLSQLAVTGYQRLAFGNITDALQLLYTDCPDRETLAALDLFMVSDIKRGKDGVLEIKFVDRLKALDRLESMTREGNAGVSELMEAIGKGARLMGGDTDD